MPLNSAFKLKNELFLYFFSAKLRFLLFFNPLLKCLLRSIIDRINLLLGEDI